MVNFVDSTLKVTASEDLNIEKDLEQKEPEKTIADLIKDNEKSEKTE